MVLFVKLTALKGHEGVLFNFEHGLETYDYLLDTYGAVCRVKGILGVSSLYLFRSHDLQSANRKIVSGSQTHEHCMISSLKDMMISGSLKAFSRKYRGMMC